MQTIYFGGGTPSRLDPAAIARIVDRIAADRTIAAGAEITLEANPEDVSTSAAAAWRAAGVNRVSLGVQSFDPAVLRWMHRTHTADQVPAAVDALRSAGIEDVSLDLIFGLPASLGRRWDDDLAAALALEPSHLSLYGLTVEAGTPLGRWTERGEVAPVDDERYAAEFLPRTQSLDEPASSTTKSPTPASPGTAPVTTAPTGGGRPFWAWGLPPTAAGAGNGSGTCASGRRMQPRWRGMPTPRGREELDDEAVAIEELYLGLRTVEGLPPRPGPARHPRPLDGRAGPDHGRPGPPHRGRVAAAGRARVPPGTLPSRVVSLYIFTSCLRQNN